MVAIVRAVTCHNRSDNGPKFIAKPIQDCIAPWGQDRLHPARQRFNARLDDELLNGENTFMLGEAQIIIESWRYHYNTVRPHASLGYRPHAPEIFVPVFSV